ncbi:MAG: hypothetical protein GXO88_02305 [Chlorobi bacterium]|nr:hypothetical protein [Chlorobiota bacterium]
MDIRSRAFYTVILFLFGVLFFSCVRESGFKTGKKVICTSEKLSKNNKQFVAENDSAFFFDGGRKQTDICAHNGRYSVYTTPGKKAFAFGVKISGLEPESYLRISVWRKSKDGKGALVASAKKPKDYYSAVSYAVEKGENGWERLELEVFIPPLDNFREVFSFYVWNNSKDTVYFDDFSIERLKSKTYPVYKESPLIITLDTNEYLKLYEKRKRALSNGILQTADNDWVKGIVFGGDKMMKAKLRLKGDWLDHLKGDKWSFRIKMKKNNAWKRMRTFSIQTPFARNFLMEWTSHKLYDNCGVLTTRYGFVPVYINNQNKGLYAYEEHFVKQLLESRKRQEGPIVKFNEDAFWQVQKVGIKTSGWPSFPYYQTAVIRPFSTSKVIETPTLYKQFLNSQILMNQYKKGLKDADQIFDIDRLAAYYAVLDLTHARHGMAWHNQRFYYNPIIEKLEPIAYDGYTDHSKPDLSINDNFAHVVINQELVEPEQFMYYRFFKQTKFVNKYLYFLKKFSDEGFVDQFAKNINGEAVLYDSLLRKEFNNYDFNFNFYNESAKEIRNYLPSLKKEIEVFLAGNAELNVESPVYSDTTVFEDTPEFFVNAYLESVDDDSVVVKVFNYCSRKIIILGTSVKKKYVSSFQQPAISMGAYNGDTVQVVDVETDTGCNYLFFMLDGRFETYKVGINKWPSPQGLTAQQQLLEAAELESYKIIESIKGNEVAFRNGEHIVNYNIIIPPSYKLVIPAGTEINLVDSAMIISYSPVFIYGTKEKPVIIKSADFSANGFTVLQAEGRSQLKNVRFENLNTLDYKGWTLSGAVTFYESDVDLDNVSFYRNQCEDALNIKRSDFTVKNSSFDYIFSDAFDSDFCTGIVDNLDFTNIGNDAIDFSGSEITILNTHVAGAQDKGISGGEESHLIVKNCFIENANIGIASKDLSVVDISDTKIVDCNYGLVLLQKKPEYGPAKIIMDDVLFVNPKTERLIEQGSVILENGKTTKGKEKDVAKRFY